jgi:thiamine biosynthesis protein ThiS
MQVVINGQSTSIDESETVAELVERLGLQGRIAVEINGYIVNFGQFETHRLGEGDVIEIVRAIGGG